MLRFNKSLIAISLLATFGLTACDNKDNNKKNEEERIIAYKLIPADGASLTMANDVNPVIPGLQIYPKIMAAGIRSGSSLVLTNQTANDSVTAMLFNGVAEFPAITLNNGRNDFTVKSEADEDSYDLGTLWADDSGAINPDGCALAIDIPEDQTFLFRHDNNQDYRDGLQITIRVDSNCPENTAITLVLGNSPDDLENSTLKAEEAIVQKLAAGYRYVFNNVTISSPAEEHLVTRYIQARATDKNQTKSAIIKMNIDGMPPVFSNIQPKINSFINMEDVTLTATAQGIEAGQPAAITVAGAQDIAHGTIINTTISANSQINAAIKLSSGLNIITLAAQDQAGNISRNSFNITTDFDAPVFTVADPFASETFDSTNHPELTAAANGYNIPVKIILDTAEEIDGSSFSASILNNYDGSSFNIISQKDLVLSGNEAIFDFGEVFFPVGNYEVKFRVRDAAGNQNEKTVTVSVINAPQNITLNLSENGRSCLAADHQEISGTIALTGPVSCSLWQKEGTEAFVKQENDVESDENGNFTFTALNIPTDKLIAVRVLCSQNDTYVGASAVYNLVVDTNAPVINKGTFINPPPEAHLNAQTIDADTEQPGLQQDISIVLQAAANELVPQGMMAELVATANDKIIDSQLVPYIDGSTLTFNKLTVMEEGQQKSDTLLSIYLLDCAGNRSVALSSNLYISYLKPVITQQLPSTSRHEFGIADDTTVYTDEITLTFTYLVENVDKNAEAVLSFGGNKVYTGESSTTNNRYTMFTFADIPFEDGSYTAQVTITDAFGNQAEYTYDFTIVDSANQISFVSPTDNSILNTKNDRQPQIAGYQAYIVGNIFGYEAGSTIYLYSEQNGNYTEVTNITHQGSARRASFVFDNATIPEGTQKLYLKAVNPAGTKEITSEPLNVIVDTGTPVINAFAINSNDVRNDTDDMIRLSALEGTPNGNNLQLAISLTVSGLGTATGNNVKIYSDNPAPNSLVGQAKLQDNTPAEITINLLQGLQNITIVATDEHANVNQASELSSHKIYVDSVAPTIVVANPVKEIFTAADGQLEDNKLVLPVQIIVSDNTALTGTIVQISENGSKIAERTITSAITQTAMVIDLPFNQGSNLARGQSIITATITDNGGNTAISAPVVYNYDYLPPQVSLKLRYPNQALATCDGENSICTPDIITTGDDKRTFGYAYLDTENYDLAVTTAGCPCEFSLVSTLDGGNQQIVDTVFNSTFHSDEENVSGLYTDFATPTPAIGPGFLPGHTRIVRLKAIDANGNVGYSDPLYLNLNFTSSALVIVERALRDETDNQRYLDTGNYLGKDDLTALSDDDSTMNTNLLITVDDFSGNSLTGADIKLTTSSGTGHTTYENKIGANNQVLLESVIFDLSINDVIPNSLNIEITKDGRPIAFRQIDKVIADITPPTYKWLREGTARLGGLREFNVPYDDNGISDIALWNAKLDRQCGDSIGENGLNTTTTPLVLEVFNIEENQPVVLSSNLTGYPLSGATATTSNCDKDTHKCLAIFNNLTVPTLPAGQQHAISVTVTDKAGNVSETNEAENILAIVDTMSPAAISPTVCLGESTTSETAFGDKYEDAPICQDICSAATCSRREGKVTLAWQLSAEAALENSSYIIGYKAIGYGPNGFLSDCASLEGDLANNEQITLDGAQSATVTADENGLATYTLNNVPLHHDYCFVVQAIDEADNYSELGVHNTQRALPLRTWPKASPLNGLNADGQDNSSPFFTSSDPADNQKYGNAPANIGDIDGDGLNDFAIGSSSSNGSDGKVELFLSSSRVSDGTTLPDYTFLLNFDQKKRLLGFHVADNNPHARFSHGGDLTGDGVPDLVLAASGAKNYYSDAKNGAVFVYDGALLAKKQLINQEATALKPNWLPSTAFYYNGSQSSLFGQGLILGDINNDQTDDLIIGSYTNGPIAIYYGGQNFPQNDVIINSDNSGANQPNVTISGKSPFGMYMAMGDYNGDNVADLAISGPSNKNIAIFFGPLDKAAYTLDEADQTIELSTTGLYNLPKTGDMTADSLLIANSSTVTLTAIPGSQNGLNKEQAITINNKNFAGKQLGNFGSAVTLLGDFDHDGKEEIAVTAVKGSTVVIFEYTAVDGLPVFKAETMLYGNTAVNDAYSFGYGIANIGNYLGANQPDALLVTEGNNGYGAFHIFW